MKKYKLIFLMILSTFGLFVVGGIINPPVFGPVPVTGTNTGDETNATIKTKLGAASSTADGYLTSNHWSLFNAKQAAGSYLTVKGAALADFFYRDSDGQLAVLPTSAGSAGQVAKLNAGKTGYEWTGISTSAKNTLNIISISSAMYADKAGDYVCAGTGSDQTTFTTAIAAMKAGDTLVVYPGTYTFSNTLTIDKGVNIFGVDRSLCSIVATGNYNLIDVTAPGTCFKYLTFTVTAGQTENTWPLVKLDTAANACKVEDCAFSSILMLQIASSLNNVERCVFDTTNATCIDLLANSQRNTISHNLLGYLTNTFYGISANGGYNDAGSHCIIANNIINGFYGIRFATYSLQDLKISNNEFNVIVYAAVIESMHATATFRDVFILGNHITGYDHYMKKAITLKGVENAVVSNNIISLADEDFVYLADGSGGKHTTGTLICNNNGTGTNALTGGVTEADANQDYTELVNNTLGTITLVGTHSVNRDVVAPTTPTIVNKTDDFTLQESDNGKIITNFGATKNIKGTMTGGLSEGWCCTFVNQVGGVAGNDAYTKLLLHMDNNVTDSSSGARTVTNNSNNVTFSNSYCKWGYAAVFNANANTYLSIPAGADNNFGTGNFTFDGWVIFSSVAHSNSIFSIGDSGIPTDGYMGLNAQLNSAGGYNPAKIMLGIQNGGWASVEWDWTATAEVPYHLALQRTSNNVRLYVNGVSMGDKSLSVAVGTSSDAIIVGKSTEMTLDEFRISKGIARYTYNFTPPTVPYQVSSSCLSIAPPPGGQLPGATAINNLLKSIATNELIKIRVANQAYISDGAYPAAWPDVTP